MSPDDRREALSNDAERLRAAGITLFGIGGGDAGEPLQVRVAAADASAAERAIQARHGPDVVVEVVAQSAYLVQGVRWVSWEDDGCRLTVHVCDYTDGAGLSAALVETDDEIAVTVSGPRWQGPHHEPGHSFTRTVQLSRPVGGRKVIDGAVGIARPRRRSS